MPNVVLKCASDLAKNEGRLEMHRVFILDDPEDRLPSMRRENLLEQMIMVYKDKVSITPQIHCWTRDREQSQGPMHDLRNWLDGSGSGRSVALVHGNDWPSDVQNLLLLAGLVEQFQSCLFVFYNGTTAPCTVKEHVINVRSDNRYIVRFPIDRRHIFPTNAARAEFIDAIGNWISDNG